MALDFEKLGGILPAVVQDAASSEVLMVAFMNREAFEKTVQTGYAHYYSRSRRRLWKKGEGSGHLQQLIELRVDCDQDAVLLKVNQIHDTACHTGHRSCFYRVADQGELRDTEWS